MGGRLTNRAGQVAADTERGQTRGDGRTFAAAGAAGGVAPLPRVLGAAVDQVVSLEPEDELRHVGVAEKYAAGVLEPGYRRGVGSRDVVLEQLGAARRPHTGSVDGVPWR